MYLENLHSKLPANFISNREFCILIDPEDRPDGFTPDTADTWIFERSGIRTRPYLDTQNVGTARCNLEAELNFASLCVQESLSQAQYTAVDAILTIRSSPHHFIPGLSQRLLRSLNHHYQTPEKSLFTLDLLQPSTGVLSALLVARSLPFRKILIVASEIFSPLLNLKDPGTAMLFGDAAASFIVSKDETPDSQFEILGECFYASSDEHSVLTSESDPHSFKMKGPELFRKIIPEFKKSARQILAQTKLELSQIDHYLPHQANRRILERAAHAVGFSPEQIITNIERVGNLSSASMLVALHDFQKSRKLELNQRVLLNACGAGLSSGAAVFRLLQNS